MTCLLLNAFVIVGVSSNSSDVGGDFDHLVAYLMVCTLKIDYVCTMGYGSISFGLLNEVIIRDDLACLEKGKGVNNMKVDLCLEQGKAGKAQGAKCWNKATEGSWQKLP